MTDTFLPLTDCGEALPAARVVDRVSYHRLVPLTIKSADGSTHQAVVPPDHAIPEVVKELATRGWPTENLIDARHGLALLSKWEAPAEQAMTQAITHHTVEDVDQFLAEPVVTVGDRAVRLALQPVNVQALLRGGSTLVRPTDGPAVLVELTKEAWTAEHAVENDGQVVIRDIASTLARQSITVGRERYQLSRSNVRQLREQGSTWIGGRDGENGQEIRLISTSGSHIDPQYLELLTASAMDVYKVTFADDIKKQEFIEPLPDFPFVAYLAYEQVWTLRGYARGDLLNSISLAPQEETTIEISSWDRQRRTDDTTTESGWESSLDVSWTNRATHEVVRDVAKNESWKLTDLGVDIPTGQGASTVGVDLAGDFGTAINDVNKTTCASVDELTVRGAAKFRGMRQTKVSESREWGFEEKTTRKLHNPNLCRSVTYDVFETLAAYDVATRPLPEHTRLAVLVQSPLALTFNRWTVLAYEGVLRGSLLDAAQEPGFEAARWLAARDEYCSLCAEPPCCPDTARPALETKAPETTQTSGNSSSQSAADRVTATGDKVAAAIIAIRDATYTTVKTADAAGVRGAALEPAILEYRQWLFRTFGLEWFQPGFWGSCQRFVNDWPSNKTPERVEQLLNETSSAWLEAVGRASLAILLAQAAIPVIAVQLVGYLKWDIFWYAQFTIRGFDDAGLGAQLSAARADVDAWRTTVALPPPTTQYGKEPVNERKEAAEAAGAPKDPFPHEEIAARRVAERALLAHLQQHRSHYHDAVWRSINPTDRMRILDYILGNLGPDLEPDLLGFVGDRMAVPFRIENYPNARERFDAAIAALVSAAPNPPQTVVLPTPGIHMQARLGTCDACEPYVTNLREIELAERRVSLARLESEAEQARLERDRLEARLSASPPLLDDPQADAAPIQVHIVRDEGNPEE